jgi:NAD(P)-dependent dehydrogenase (short-subunit alcohol dehydrogenase family)
MAAEFANKIALITGAGGNVGSAVAKRFAAGGAKLVLVNRTADALETLVSDLGGVDIMTSVANLSHEGAVDTLVSEIEERYGRIDILAHTVGGFASGRAVYEPGLDQLEMMWALNVIPTYIVTGRVARHMMDKGVRGHITVIAARSGLKGASKTAAYTASKSAAMRIVESLALEVRDRGIHVNSVLPSTLDTPQNREAMPNADASKWVTPEELADTIAFLSSEASNGLYGANVEVYGRS